MARPRGKRERTKCGKQKRQAKTVALIDRGHDYVIEKRAALIDGDGRDELAGYPLGILFARRLILRGDHKAGKRYAALSAAVWGSGRNSPSYLGKIVASVRNVDDPIPETDPLKIEASMHRARHQLDEAVAAVRALPSSRPFHVLENIVVYERPMRFMDSERRRSAEGWRADQADIDALQLALGTLAELWGMDGAA